MLFLSHEKHIFFKHQKMGQSAKNKHNLDPEGITRKRQVRRRRRVGWVWCGVDLNQLGYQFSLTGLQLSQLLLFSSI